MKKITIFFALLLAGWLSQVAVAHAASLYFSPSSGAKTVGQTFAVGIDVNTDQAMNASDGIINFPTDKMEVVSLDKSVSLFNLWMPEPTFSNSAGTVSYSGIIFNPGYTGTAGRLININFRPKIVGSASLGFSSGNVYANDGNGTNITSGLGTASFTFAEAPPPPPQLPGAPSITSPTHPNQNSCYANQNPQFQWAMGSATGVSFAFDQSASTDPDTNSEGTMNSQNYTDVPEGTSYFHAKLLNSVGWSGTTHFKVQIDVTKPEYFNLTYLGPVAATPKKVQFKLEAFDRVCGLDHFEIRIDDMDPINWTDDGSHIFTSPTICPGDHTVTIKALDRAGNYLAKTFDFVTEGCGTLAPTEPGGGLAGTTLVTVTTTEIRYVTTTIIEYLTPATEADKAKGIEYYMATNMLSGNNKGATLCPFGGLQSLPISATGETLVNKSELDAKIKALEEANAKLIQAQKNAQSKDWLSLFLMALLLILPWTFYRYLRLLRGRRR